MFRSTSIARNFTLMAAAAVALMLVMVVLIAQQMRHAMLEMKRAEIRNTVEAAATTLQAAYGKAQAEGLAPREALTRAAEVLRNTRFDGGNYFYVHDFTGFSILLPVRKDLEGKNNINLKDPRGTMILQEFIKTVKAQNAGFSEYYWKKPGQEVETLKISYNVAIPGTETFVGSGLYVDDVDAALLRQAGQLSFFVIPLLLGFIGLAVMLGRHIAGALARLRTGVEGISTGRLDTPISDVERGDEIGVVARALQVFRDALIAQQGADAEAKAAREREDSRAARITQAIHGFEQTAESVVVTITTAATQLESAANVLSVSANDTTEQASTVSSAAAHTSSSFHGLAAAGEQLSASASEISRILDECSNASAGAVANVRASDGHAQALSSAASRIGAVLGLINGLAEQTNLLALNATIEAARAGDAGRGFAVVANEVKALASQTAVATGEISAVIVEMQQATGLTVQAIKAIDGSIEMIERATREIGTAVGEQERATREIAGNVQQAVGGTEDVSRAIAEVSSTAHDTASAAGQVHTAAGQLARQAQTVRDEVRRFLDEVRAA